MVYQNLRSVFTICGWGVLALRLIYFGREGVIYWCAVEMLLRHTPKCLAPRLDRARVRVFSIAPVAGRIKYVPMTWVLSGSKILSVHGA